MVKPVPAQSNDSHGFVIGPTDTDSISFCKADGSEFTEEERASLLKELNENSPEFIQWEDDGYYPICIALKAKNYILFDGKKKKIKGSAFKTSSKEPAMKEMMLEFVDQMIANPDDFKPLTEIYHKYVREALAPTDLKRWVKKVSVSESVLKCKGYTEEDIKNKVVRRNETDIWDAIKDVEGLQEGDRFWLYPYVVLTGVEVTTTKTGKVKEKPQFKYGLKRLEAYDPNNPDIDIDQLLKRCYNTVEIFDNIVNSETYFTNYTLVKNKPLLEELKKS